MLAPEQSGYTIITADALHAIATEAVECHVDTELRKFEVYLRDLAKNCTFRVKLEFVFQGTYVSPTGTYRMNVGRCDFGMFRDQILKKLRIGNYEIELSVPIYIISWAKPAKSLTL